VMYEELQSYSFLPVKVFNKFMKLLDQRSKKSMDGRRKSISKDTFLKAPKTSKYPGNKKSSAGVVWTVKPKTSKKL